MTSSVEHVRELALDATHAPSTDEKVRACPRILREGKHPFQVLAPGLAWFLGRVGYMLPFVEVSLSFLALTTAREKALSTRPGERKHAQRQRQRQRDRKT